MGSNRGTAIALVALGIAGIAAFLLLRGGPGGDSAPRVPERPEPPPVAPASPGPVSPAPAVPPPLPPGSPTVESSETPAAPAGRGVLVVTVVGLPSGAPIEGAAVEVRDAEGEEPLLSVRTTGPDGLARFEGLDRNSVSIRATAPGRVPGRTSASELRSPGERAVTVDLEPGVALGGVVLVAGSRKPVPGAKVLAEMGGRIGGMSSASAHPFLAETAADADGRFRVDGIPRKEIVTLRAVVAGFVPGERSLLLGEGAEEHPAIEILLEEGVAAAGIVYDPGGRSLEGVEVCAFESDPAGGAEALAKIEESLGPWCIGHGVAGESRTGNDGRFRIDGLRAGRTYRLCARGVRHGFARSRVTDPPLSTATPGQEIPVDLRLRPPSRIRVGVKDGKGTPRPDARVVIEISEFGTLGPEKQDDGTFLFDFMVPGAYPVSARLDGHKPGREEVAVGEGETKEVLLVLEQKAPEVPAAEAPPAPRPGRARIRLVPPAGSALPARVTVAVEDVRKGGGTGWTRPWTEGIVLVDDLPSGQARIVISVEGFAPVIREVEVPAGEERDLGSATLDAGAELAGAVQDAAGRPLAGARVWVQLPGFMDDAVATTGADGRYRVPRLPIGDLHVRVASEGMLDLRETVAVAPGVNSRTFILAPAISVRGTVRNGEGEPVEGVIVAFLLQGEVPPGARGEEWDTTDGNGSWDLAVVAGAYAVEVRDGRGGVLLRREAAFDGKSEGRLDLVVP